MPNSDEEPGVTSGNRLRAYRALPSPIICLGSIFVGWLRKRRAAFSAILIAYTSAFVSSNSFVISTLLPDDSSFLFYCWSASDGFTPSRGVRLVINRGGGVIKGIGTNSWCIAIE